MQLRLEMGLMKVGAIVWVTIVSQWLKLSFFPLVLPHQL